MSAFTAEGQNGFQRLIGGTSHERGQGLFETYNGLFVINGASLSFGQGSADVMLVKTDAQGQTIWSKVYGTTYFDNSEFAIETPDHGFICIGRSALSGGATSAMFFKTDSAGSYLWGKSFGGNQNDGLVHGINTLDGGYAFTGNTKSIGNGSDDILLIRTDANGDTIFTRAYGTPQSEAGISVTQLPDSGFVICGRQVTGVSSANGVMIRVDKNGDLIWNWIYQNQNWDELESVLPLNNNDLIIAGSTVDSLSDYNVMLMKTDSSGFPTYAFSYGGDKIDAGYNVMMDADTNFVISGYTESFGYGHSLMGTDSTNIFLMKTYKTGSIQWFETYGDGLQDEAYRSAKASDGGYLISGFTTDYTPPDSSQMMMIKTDADGLTGCHEQSVTVNVSALATIVTNAGFVQTSGLLPASMSLVENSVAPSNNDACLFSGISSASVNDELIITPNPFSEMITLKLQSGSVDKISVYDASGRLCMLQKANGMNEMTIPMHDLQTGVYYLKAESNNAVVVRKIVKAN